MNTVNVYDFDGTIYDGESTFDFFLYCLCRRPALFRYLFTVVFHLIGYKLCLVSKEKLLAAAKKNIVGMFNACPDVVSFVAPFWETHRNKLKPWYTESRAATDIVISASFGFMLRDMCPYIGLDARRLICSEVDLDTLEITRLSFRENKPVLFGELFPDTHIGTFYTDSENDIAMMRLADRVCLVKKNTVSDYPVPKGDKSR